MSFDFSGDAFPQSEHLLHVLGEKLFFFFFLFPNEVLRRTLTLLFS